MKFFGKKSLSSLIFWLSTISFITISALILLILISLIFNTLTISSDNQFSISIPFTGSLIQGEYNTAIFVALIAFMMFYGIFFYLLRAIFKAFSHEKVIFTKKTINRIRQFAWLNIFLPPLGIIAVYFIRNWIDFETIMQGGLLVLLGIFSLFVIAVFKEGIILQEETDLTI